MIFHASKGEGEIIEKRSLKAEVNGYSNPRPTPRSPEGGPLNNPFHVETLHHDGFEYNKKPNTDFLTDNLDYGGPRTSPNPPRRPTTDDLDYTDPHTSPGPPGGGPSHIPFVI